MQQVIGQVTMTSTTSWKKEKKHDKKDRKKEKKHNKKKLKSMKTKRMNKTKLSKRKQFTETSSLYSSCDCEMLYIQAEVIEILGRTGKGGKITRVRVMFECEPGRWRRSIRNVRGPIKMGDMLCLLDDVRRL